MTKKETTNAVDFTQTEWGKVLLHISYIFCMRIAESWKTFVDKVATDFPRYQQGLQDEIADARIKRQNLIIEKSTLLGYIDASVKHVSKSKYQYLHTVPTAEVVKGYRLYKDTQDQRYLADYQNYLQYQKDKDAAREEYQKALDENNRLKEMYRQFMDNHSMDTSRLNNIINNRQWQYDRVSAEVAAMLKQDEKHVYDLFLSDACCEAIARRIKGVLNRFSNGDFDVVLTNDEKENVIDLLADYILKMDVNTDFLRVIYNDTEKEKRKELKDPEFVIPLDEFKILGKFDDKEIAYKIFNAFATTFLGYVRMSYEVVRNKHYRFDSIDAMIVNENDDDNYANRGLHNQDLQESKEGATIYDAKKKRAKNVDVSKLFNEDARVEWGHGKKHLLAHADDIAENVLDILGEGILDKTDLVNKIRQIVDMVDVNLIRNGWIGRNLNHFIEDVFGGFVSNKDKTKITEAIASSIQLELCEYFIKNIIQRIKDESVSYFDIDAYSEKLYNFVMRHYNKVRGKMKWGSCEDMVASLEKEANIEQRIEFLTEKTPNTPPISKADTYYMKSI